MAWQALPRVFLLVGINTSLPFLATQKLSQFFLSCSNFLNPASRAFLSGKSFRMYEVVRVSGILRSWLVYVLLERKVNFLSQKESD